MRAAIVYDCLFPLSRGGGERVYRRIAEELVLRGFEVDYLTRDVWSPEPPPETRFRLVPVWRGEIYDADGVRTTSSAIRFAVGVYRRLHVDRARYDLVIASALPVLTLIAARLAVGRHPGVLVGDWLEVWSWRTWRRYAGIATGTVAAALQWVGTRSATRHTVNSGFTADRLRRIRSSADVIEWGLVDLAQARPTAPAAAPPYLLVVGRLIGDKRVDAMPAALALMRRTVPGLRAVVVGTGPERERVAAAAHEHGVADAVELAGAVSDDELDRLRGAAAALVHPSRREGFGLVVAEAAAAGLPVVVVRGDDNAAVELVEDGVNGAIAESAAPAELAAAVLRVLAAGPSLRARSREWFDVTSRTRGLAASLDRLLN